MVTKEEFTNIILVVKEYYKKEEKLTKYLHEFLMDGHSIVNFTGKLRNTLLNLLAKNFSEKYAANILQDIETFIYEYLFSNKTFKINYTENGIKKEYKINAIDELYDFIQEFYVNTKGENDEDI